MLTDGTYDEPKKFSPLFTRKAAADYLCISERLLWTITDRGDLPRIKVNRSVRYAQADLDAYIDRRRQGGRSGSEAA